MSCRFHDLRHTSVALAIAAGAHPKAIQSRMGHSSISVTLDRYGYLFPELDEAIAEAFGRSLHEATERRSRVVLRGDFGAVDSPNPIVSKVPRSSVGTPSRCS